MKTMISTKYKMIKMKMMEKVEMMMMVRLSILTITKESMPMTMLVKSINAQRQEHILNQRIYADDFIQLLIRGSHLN